jgi:cytoskeletal protein RodZ
MMKISSASCILLGAILPIAPASAAQPSPSHASNPKPHAAVPASTPTPTPVTKTPETSATPPASPIPPATTPTSSLTLDAYIADLADQVPLAKNEQTDIKTYYLNDGAKLQAILNDASLSPLTQEQQIDDLRNARNAKIEALLSDVGRQSVFLKLEGNYRVALVELAAQGGLVPSSPPPNVPQPTATAPAQADKTAPGM